jgi:hypothetical protein
MQRMNRGVAAALAGAAGVWLCACSARADVVASWNFNALSGTVPATVQADAGKGVASFAEFTGGLGSLAGTDVNALTGDVAGQALSVTGSGQNGKSVVFEVDATGLSQLSISLASRRSSSGFSAASIDVWNGSAWQHAATFDASTTQWQQHQFSLSEFTVLNNGTARLRLKVENATSGSGNIRFDNVRVEGVPVPGPAGAAAIGAAGVATAARRGGRADKPADGDGKDASPAKRTDDKVDAAPAPKRARAAFGSQPSDAVSPASGPRSAASASSPKARGRSSRASG